MKATMTLLVVAGLAAIALLASPTVADLQFGDPITVNGTAGPEFGGTIWGTHGTLGNQDNGLPHLFGGVSVYEDDVFAGLGLVVIVNSVELTPPPGKRFAGVIVFDFTSFDPGFLTNHSIDIGPIKSPGENPINTVDLIGPGSVFTDGSSIFWDGLGADLSLNPMVAIQWTQVQVPSCPWDCQDTPNGLVDIADMFKLFGHWGAAGPCDFDGVDGGDIVDLFKMFGNWGQCP